MNVGCAIYDKSVVFGQLLAPRLFISVNSLIIPVVSAPKNRFSIHVQELIGYYTAIIGFNVHNADSVIALSANRNGVTSYNVQQKILVGTCNNFTHSLDITLDCQISFITTMSDENRFHLYRRVPVSKGSF